MVGRASPRSLPIRLLTSPHDAIISNRWRSPQANFNTRCDGTPSRGVVAQEALDVAHYITDMTAQLEAMAVAARLDLLAYFLGMAKAESELFVRTNAVAEAEHEANAEAEESYAAESAIRQPHASNSFD
jgi:hypothetical protein